MTGEQQEQPKEKKPIGKVEIVIHDDLSYSLHTYGIMESAGYLDLAAGYLKQYTDRRWSETWQQSESSNE